MPAHSAEAESFEYVIEAELSPLTSKVELHLWATTKLLPASIHPREEPIEHIFEATGTSASPSTLGRPLDPLFSQLIIDPSLLRITQCLICICNLLKLLLCTLRIVLVLVRVVANGQFLEGLLDFFVGSPFGDA